MLCTWVVVTVSAELRPLPGFGCFGLVGAFLGGEWVCFLQPMTAHRWGWEWIKHRHWTPFRPEKMVDADVAVGKRNYSSSEVKHQAAKARSRTRENLSLTFSHFRALTENKIQNIQGNYWLLEIYWLSRMQVTVWTLNLSNSFVFWDLTWSQKHTDEFKHCFTGLYLIWKDS